MECSQPVDMRNVKLWIYIVCVWPCAFQKFIFMFKCLNCLCCVSCVSSLALSSTALFIYSPPSRVVCACSAVAVAIFTGTSLQPLNAFVESTRVYTIPGMLRALPSLCGLKSKWRMHPHARLRHMNECSRKCIGCTARRVNGEYTIFSAHPTDGAREKERETCDVSSCENLVRLVRVSVCGAVWSRTRTFIWIKFLNICIIKNVSNAVLRNGDGLLWPKVLYVNAATHDALKTGSERIFHRQRGQNTPLYAPQFLVPPLNRRFQYRLGSVAGCLSQPGQMSWRY